MKTTASAQLTPAQRRLLEGATAAFAESGYGGTSTRDIAARAQRSPAAVYIHHESKEDLLYAVSVRGHEDALECLQAAARTSDEPVEKLKAMVEAFSLWHMDNAELGRVVHYEFHAMTGEHRSHIAALRRTFRGLMASVIEEGVDAGVFEVGEPTQAADAVLSLSIDLVRWFDPGRRRDRHAIARSHADFAWRIVRREQSATTHGATRRSAR